MAEKWFSIRRPSAISNFKKCHIWSRDCHGVPNLLLCTKFHQNRFFSLRYGNLTIFKMAAVRHVEFSKFEVCHVTSISLCYLLPHAKFHWNLTIACWVMAKKNNFQYGGCPPSCILNIFIFGQVAVIKFQICCCVSNFIKIKWFVIEIWRFHDGPCPPSLILGVEEWVLWKSLEGLPIGSQLRP